MPTGGGGGNRTRVLRRFSRASPGAARCAFLGPPAHASEYGNRPSHVGSPPAPVAVAGGGPPVDARS